MVKNLFFTFCLLVSIFNCFAQGTESFTNIPASSSSYSLRNWTGDNTLAWSATNARTDLTITGKAITCQVGSVFCNSIPNGISSLSFKHQQNFTGSNPLLQVYINNTLVGTANPTTTVATTTINAINIAGNFNLEIRSVTSGLRIAIDDISWTAFNAIPCTTPAAQPTNLILTPTPTTVSGSFTSSAGTDANLIVRSTTASLSSNPVNTTNYATGNSIGGGTVVAVTSSTSFVDNGLNPSTNYYYFVFAFNDQDCSGGPVYNTVSALTNNTSTLALPACSTPSPATNLLLTPANTFISCSFTAAVDANRYLSIISTNATLSASPVNGTVYSPAQSLGGGTVIAFSTGTTFNATGLTANTQYYLFVFSANAECSGAPFYNTTALTGTTTTTNNSTGIPAGFYDAASGQSCQTLKSTLRGISANNHIALTYTPGVWNAYQYTDLHRNDANTADIIWDIYSDNPNGPEAYTYTYGTNQCGSYSGEGSCYNREHSTPQSWFGGTILPMHTDLHHLFPTDGYVNNTRSSFPYGEVITNSVAPSTNGSKLGTGTNFGYSSTVFEPIDAYKGDLARASFYMAARYENEIIASNWSGLGSANAVFLSAADEPNAANRKLQIYDTWYLKTIYKWHLNDPVSQKEIDRNNGIYYQSGQGNRNPFVDHPEYIALIWQCTGVLPVTITDFTAAKQNESVLLKWYATYETNFKQYVIERSTDAVNFYKIGELTGRNLANYAFTDNNLPSGSIVYYRLKMIDIDGSFNFSKTIAVRLNNNFSNALVYPNPTMGLLKIKLTQPLATSTTLIVTDISGRIVKQQQVAKANISIDLDVMNLPAGRYFFKINDTQMVINESFVIIK